jgi:hypothetical protein
MKMEPKQAANFSVPSEGSTFPERLSLAETAVHFPPAMKMFNLR